MSSIAQSVDAISHRSTLDRTDLSTTGSPAPFMLHLDTTCKLLVQSTLYSSVYQSIIRSKNQNSATSLVLASTSSWSKRERYGSGRYVSQRSSRPYGA